MGLLFRFIDKYDCTPFIKEGAASRLLGYPVGNESVFAFILAAQMDCEDAASELLRKSFQVRPTTQPGYSRALNASLDPRSIYMGYGMCLSTKYALALGRAYNQQGVNEAVNAFQGALEEWRTWRKSGVVQPCE